MIKRDYKTRLHTELLAYGVSAFLLAAAGVGLGGCAENEGGAKVPESMAQDVDASQNRPETADADSVPDILEVHFLDVGQGDSTLIICGEEAMLIDAGDNEQIGRASCRERV